LTGFYWAVKNQSIRLYIIFLGSSFFYAFWKPEFLLLLYVATGLDFILANLIGKSVSSLQRRAYLILSICSNIALLAYFKYFLFIYSGVENFVEILGYKISSNWLAPLLPLGISFYTFEAISYIVDVYRGYIKPQKNYLKYGCFITFFPKLIAGPILRPAEIIPQFSKLAVARSSEIASGINRIITGLFLKVVLADNLAPMVDAGFLLPIDDLSALDILTLSFLFGFQIYFDFSGYSNIAIGSARLLGIHIPENFNYPYLSKSPREFWRRWHISLSSWVRDYLYLPMMGLVGKDVSAGEAPLPALRRQQNNQVCSNCSLLISWAIMGLWHGAGMNFILWGLIHALLILSQRVIGIFIKEKNNSWASFSGWLLTLIFVMLSWIPFRSVTLSDTFERYSKFIKFENYFWLGMRENNYVVAALLLLACISAYLFHELYEKHKNTASDKVILFFSASIISVKMVLVLVFLKPISQFIYFQF